ncbi:MAG: hypothetical protein AAB552_03020 [Patescibacteria group bacterium]
MIVKPKKYPNGVIAFVLATLGTLTMHELWMNNGAVLRQGILVSTVGLWVFIYLVLYSVGCTLCYLAKIGLLQPEVHMEEEEDPKK